MILDKLTIKGFRRHEEINIFFSDTTFLIGENNVVKSTILEIINILFNDTVKKLVETDYYSYLLPDGEIFSCDSVTHRS